MWIKNENKRKEPPGASNLIRKILNYSDYDEKIIEKELLDALNNIIYSDSHYSEIKVQQVEKSELLNELDI